MPADRAKRLEEARLRAEFFAKGGQIIHYPMGSHGPNWRGVDLRSGRFKLADQYKLKKERR